MSDEEWAPVRDAPGYEVSSHGRVRNGGGLVMRQQTSNGYHRIQIDRRQMLVHRLVAEAYIPNPEGNAEVNHIDGDKSNNRVSNLEWVTPSENVRKAYETGLRKKPSKRHMAKMLAASNVARRHPVVRSDGMRFESVGEAAAASGCGHSEVCGVLSGRRRTTHGFSFKYEEEK